MIRISLLSFALILGISSVGFSQSHGHGGGFHGGGGGVMHGGFGGGGVSGYGGVGVNYYGHGYNGYPSMGSGFHGLGLPSYGYDMNFSVPANLSGFYRPLPMGPGSYSNSYSLGGWGFGW